MEQINKSGSKTIPHRPLHMFLRNKTSISFKIVEKHISPKKHMKLARKIHKKQIILWF